MTSRLRQRSLYFITPSVGSKVSADELLAVVRDAIRGGADLVQWRQKPSKADLAAMPQLRTLWDHHQSHGDAFLLPVAREIRALAKSHDVPFIVNDSVELALQLEADGVHIGQGDAALQAVRARVQKEASCSLDDFIIGVTVRDGVQARMACENGAAYLGAGPVFTSSTKPEANDGNTIGIAGLRDCTSIAQAFGVPVYAIGGLSVENGRIRQCIVEGNASGVSMIAAIGDASDKTAAARAIKDELAAAHADRST